MQLKDKDLEHERRIHSFLSQIEQLQQNLDEVSVTSSSSAVDAQNIERLAREREREALRQAADCATDLAKQRRLLETERTRCIDVERQLQQQQQQHTKASNINSAVYLLFLI